MKSSHEQLYGMITALTKRVQTLEEAEARRFHNLNKWPTWMEGAELRRCRQEAGWTAKELGDAVSLSPQTVGQMELRHYRISEPVAVRIRAVFVTAGVAAPAVRRQERTL